MTHGESDPSLQVLTTEEIYLLLATQQVGRWGQRRALPIIVPVNYGLDRGVIVIRTHPGITLAAASHANVAFEVDDRPAHPHRLERAGPGPGRGGHHRAPGQTDLEQALTP